MPIGGGVWTALQRGGRLGRKTFARIVNDPRLAQLPGCLETPKSPDLHEDARNLAVLRALRRSPGCPSSARGHPSRRTGRAQAAWG